MTYETLIYDIDGAIATITLNRPGALNTIVPPMPDEFEQAGREGVGSVIAARDGPFGDYSQAEATDKPAPRNVIEPLRRAGVP